MGNIAERLLILAGNINLRPEESELCADAAEEIERLRSRVAELEARVAHFEEATDWSRLHWSDRVALSGDASPADDLAPVDEGPKRGVAVRRN